MHTVISFVLFDIFVRNYTRSLAHTPRPRSMYVFITKYFFLFFWWTRYNVSMKTENTRWSFVARLNQPNTELIPICVCRVVCVYGNENRDCTFCTCQLTIASRWLVAGNFICGTLFICFFFRFNQIGHHTHRRDDVCTCIWCVRRYIDKSSMKTDFGLACYYLFLLLLHVWSSGQVTITRPENWEWIR